jgi:hypothetical protein
LKAGKISKNIYDKKSGLFGDNISFKKEVETMTKNDTQKYKMFFVHLTN